MAYTVVKIKNIQIKKQSNEILIALLNEFGYDSFQEHIDGIDAYIEQDKFDEKVLISLQSMKNIPEFSYEWEVLEDTNWNAVWEENYQPVVIADKLLIRSDFHKELRQYPYEIIINPRMSFGTGHHATTSLILSEMIDSKLGGLRVLDVGCGSGILGIFASKKGATVYGVDIDNWAYENALDNIALNDITNFVVRQGTVAIVEESDFDIILANINRNVLIDDMGKYEKKLSVGGTLLLSGFYEKDIPLIIEKAEEVGLHFVSSKVENEWSLVKVVKK